MSAQRTFWSHLAGRNEKNTVVCFSSVSFAVSLLFAIDAQSVLSFSVLQLSLSLLLDDVLTGLAQRGQKGVIYESLCWARLSGVS